MIKIATALTIAIAVVVGTVVGYRGEDHHLVRRLFDGGPVEPDALIALALAHRPITEPRDELSPVSGRVVSADLTTDPAFVAAMVSAVRIFRGYAGWGPGQLEGEIDAGAWLVLDAEPSDVFASEPNQLWRTVLRRQRGRLAWLAAAPDDLSAN